MIRRHKGHFFPAQGLLPIKSHRHSFFRQIRKSIGDDIPWFQQIVPIIKLLHFEPKKVKSPRNPIFKISIPIPRIHLLENLVDLTATIRGQRKQAIVPAFHLSFGFITQDLRGRNKLIKRIRLQCLQALHQDLRTLQILLKGIQPFGIPPRITLAPLSPHKRHVNMNCLGLANPIQSPDPLFQQFRILRQIKKNQMMGKLEIPPFTSNLGTQKNTRSFLLGKVGRIAIPLKQGQFFVELRQVHRHPIQHRHGNLLDQLERLTNQQDLLVRILLQKLHQPIDLGRKIIIAFQLDQMLLPLRKATQLLSGISKHHPTGPKGIEQIRNHFITHSLFFNPRKPIRQTRRTFRKSLNRDISHGLS